jgi:hypothetical protein
VFVWVSLLLASCALANVLRKSTAYVIRARNAGFITASPALTTLVGNAHDAEKD